MTREFMLGAFGSVYLAMKKITGDYYAIKVLKKADMVAKNQVTNIKYEKNIMSQIDSPFIVNLYYSFQSRDNLYLVMEYLSGGDCAALIKALGALDEKWARQYVAEVTLGLEFLHDRGIVHRFAIAIIIPRDIKPDNLLITEKGHVKLTDFGLSRVGFLGRRTIDHVLQSVEASAQDSAASSGSTTTSPNISLFTQQPNPRPLATQPSRLSELLMSSNNLNHNRRGSFSSTKSSVSEDSGINASPILAGRLDALLMDDKEVEAEDKKFVGTPDYLAPESILGIGQDYSVDWWALGVMLYEFLYGFPPFNAETPEQVFSNILSRNIEWHADEIDLSVEARDFMERLICSDHQTRLGNNGAWEVKAHSFFKDVNWNTILTEEAPFIPKLKGVQDTDYFDSRGLSELLPVEDEPEMVGEKVYGLADYSPLSKTSEGNASDSQFGDFVYKNLPLLERANNDVVRTLSFTSACSEDGRRSSISSSPRSKNIRKSQISSPILIPSRPRLSEIASPRSDGETPSMGSQPINVNVVNKATLRVIEESGRARRNSLPSRFRVKASHGLGGSSGGGGSRPVIKLSTSSPTSSSLLDLAGASSSGSSRLAVTPTSPMDVIGKLDVLIVDAEGGKVLRDMLVGWGCRCVVARDGEEAIRSAMGSIRFDVIFMDTVLAKGLNKLLTPQS
jgi:serine/threonine-protein kinase RIM15